MTGKLIDERRYENLELEEWNDKNFERSRETGVKIKIGNLTAGVHNMREISGTKLGK